MSRVHETIIGDIGPWPDKVRVVRGCTDDERTYVPDTTCEDRGEPFLSFECSECGVRVDLEDGRMNPMVHHDDYVVVGFRHCPMCGARVTRTAAPKGRSCRMVRDGDAFRCTNCNGRFRTDASPTDLAWVVCPRCMATIDYGEDE
jgi:predicted nucleic acid-binding Zn ribbon protein